MEFGTLFTSVLALFTLVGNFVVLLLLALLFFARRQHALAMDYVGKHALMLGFLIAASSTLGSIIYSEVVGFPACILCWIQRIFMYPMMFLFGLAVYRRERMILPYMMLLTLIGGGVALYQWVKDMLALYSDVTIPCPAVSALPSCDKIFVLEYGYITIPMIALNAFVLIGIVVYAGMRRSSIEASNK